jgi:putative endonuclease
MRSKPVRAPRDRHGALLAPRDDNKGHASATVGSTPDENSLSLRGALRRSNPEALGQLNPAWSVRHEGVCIVRLEPARRQRMDERIYCVYILANERRTVLYTGVTGDLKKRIWQHQEKLAEGFTTRYNINRLVYYETSIDALSSIAREKQIKSGSRAKKIALIEAMNPQWRDLYDEL